MTENSVETTTQQAIKKEELENLCLKQELPIYKIAEKYGFNHNFKIYELMKEFNIKTRNHSEALKGKPMIKKRAKLPSKKMTTNLAYLFGVIKGDGYIGKNFIHITTSNLTFTQILKQKIIKWCGLNCSIKNYKTGSGGFLWYVFLNSAEVVDLFKSLGLSSLKTNEEKANFVKGFADAEGSVTIFNDWNKNIQKYRKNYKVAIYNSDKELIQGVQNILSSLGIKSSIYKRLPKNTFGKKPKYELVISHKSVKRFSEIIGFEYPEKNEKLNKIIGGE
jgi:intein/homing endonuclease